MMDRRVLVIVGVSAALAAGCPKNVPQELRTGEDGKVKGARAMKLENNEARARGIVTYPGGDRVDWKVIELPKEQRGAMRLKLKWTPPRPGLDLSFDVYDEYGNVVASAKPNKRKQSRKTTKTAAIANATGKLFVQIYASERGDAGQYALTAAFDPEPDPGPDSWLEHQVPDPPKLPAVPENVKRCDPLNFDRSNPDCIDDCPFVHDAKWPGCKDVCPDLAKPDPTHAACVRDAVCPSPPDKRFAKCVFAACDRRKFDATNPNCEGLTAQADDRFGQITDLQPTSLGVQLTINLGTSDGIADGWKGVLLDANDRPIRGTDFVIRKVGKNASVDELRLDPAKVPATATVKMVQP